MAVKLTDFLSKLDFKPKYEPSDPCKTCNVVLVQFETMNDITPTVEFGTEVEDDGTQYFYFEGIDESMVTDGEIIPIDSEIRVYPTYVKLTEDNLDDTVKMVNERLEEFNTVGRKH